VLSGCTDGVFLGTSNIVPFAIDDGGRIAFVADPLASPFESGTKAVVVDTTPVATSGGPFSDFGAVALDASGGVAFLASLDAGGSGIFRGSDPIADKVIATQDELFGSTVVGLGLQRGGLNAGGQIAFVADLADGRRVIARADR